MACSISQAQYLDQTWQIKGALDFALPARQFAEINSEKDVFFGLSAEVNAPLFQEKPLRAGIGFRYFWLGNKQRDVTIRDSLGVLDINTIVRGSMMPVHFFARFDLMNIYDKPVLPYASVFIGPRFFTVTTRTEIDYNDGLDPEIDYDRTTKVAISYGFNVGIHVKIKESLLLDFRWENAYGGLVEYLDTSSIVIDSEGYASYELVNTRTDINILSIGIVYCLGRY